MAIVVKAKTDTPRQQCPSLPPSPGQKRSEVCGFVPHETATHPRVPPQNTLGHLPEPIATVPAPGSSRTATLRRSWQSAGWFQTWIGEPQPTRDRCPIRAGSQRCWVWGRESESARLARGGRAEADPCLCCSAGGEEASQIGNLGADPGKSGRNRELHQGSAAQVFASNAENGLLRQDKLHKRFIFAD